MENGGTAISGKVVTAVRVRPMTANDVANAWNIVKYADDGQGIGLINPKYPTSEAPRYFGLDYSFWSVDSSNVALFSGQEHIFSKIGVPMVESCLLGYNCSLFAYGQTGSGKTYT
jgi:kinesin family protein 14